MRRIHYCLLVLCFVSNQLFAQSDSIQEVKGIPTKQIYDLMVDKKGFVWVGHDLGLSRFDGVSFTHFSNPQSTSLAVGDICEDEQGRIWFRSFSSQIFYIENEKMHLLSAYDYKSEPRFPRMVIVGNKLIATSSKGLFVCNTSTLKCKYIKTGVHLLGSGTSSLSILKDDIVAYGSDRWYLYNPGQDQINEISLHSTSGIQNSKSDLRLPPNKQLEKIDSINLQPHGLNDTIYAFSSLSGSIIKLKLSQKKLIVVGSIKTKGLMNSISPSGKDLWIHSKLESITPDFFKKISGYDLTDIVVDKENNIWLSSFKYGLLIKYINNWKKLEIFVLNPNEVITHFDIGKNLNLYGTDQGKLILENSISKKVLKTFHLPENVGQLEYIKAIDSARFVIGTSFSIFILEKERLQKIMPRLTLKDAAATNSSIMFATASGLYEFKNKKDYILNRDYQINLLYKQRCRSVCYNTYDKTVVAAFKEGVYEVKNNQFVPVLYNGLPIYSSNVREYNGKIFIATFAQGLLMLNKSRLTKINVFENQKIHSVSQIKIFKDQLWLLGTGYIEFYNANTEEPLPNKLIPLFPNTDIYDIAIGENEITVLTSDGLYKLQSSNALTAGKLNNYLMKVTVNGNDTTLQNNIVLPFNKNNIEIFLSVPFFTNPDKIYFKFRLSGNTKQDWKMSENGERIFRFSSLKPGNYTFEAIAVHPQFGNAEKPIVFKFTIQPPWYDTLLFKILLVVIVSLTVFFLVRMVFRARLKKQKIIFEKQLAVQTERQRISAEIHDDIGAGLSGVRLLTELTGKKIDDKETKEDLDKIYLSISDLSSKMRDVIWSLNSRNDTLKNLLVYIHKQAKLLLENGEMQLYVVMPDNIPAIDIGSEKRTDIYLSVKEALHNTLKHSDAKNVELHFKVENNRLYIAVNDDGKGLPPFAEGAGNGIINIKKRINRLGGLVDFKKDNGTMISFNIPLN